MPMIYHGYQLDPFQVQACRAIDQDRSVIVAAPTGAGKTVIAEYTTERCLERGQRVIYTAPIKALSNQKFRDFRALFGEDAIGIVTGDVVINPYAPVLVMTTEIFRNTIFEDASQLDDVAYVVFDEIHYINDIERGTVWEESIIFAPQHIKFVCLSATIPNLKEFSDWISSVREIPLEVISETQRPVPLEYAVYMPGWGVGTLDDLKRVAAMLQENDVEQRRSRRAPEFDPDDLIEHLRDHFRLPCLYFCFSRRGCEERARYFQTLGSLLSPQDQDAIVRAYDELCILFDVQGDPRAEEFRELIACGIAYHHAGMLPTLKEIVERLFTLGKIQLLFTTETFAVGINMPARSVVFESLEKYDGISFRYLKAREYQQMSGRAGRRGIDDRGFVYAIVHPETAQIPQVERILTGEPEPIESQFNLSYSSLLNLVDQHGERTFEVCRKSFGSYQGNVRVRRLRSQLRRAERKLQQVRSPNCRYGHEAMEVLTEYQNLQRTVSDKLLEVRARRNEVKRRFKGRRWKRERVRRLSQLNRFEASVRAELNRSPCHRCRYRNRCLSDLANVQRAQARVVGLHEEIDRTLNHQRVQIERRLALLERMGYVEGFQLLPRGEVARQIYGYELQVTELLFDGFLEDLDAVALAVLAVSMVFESKRDEWYRKLSDRRLRALLQAAADRIDRIRAAELEMGIETLTQPMDTKLAAAALAWARGCSFEELSQYTSAPEGDLIRVFRSAADLLRQMRRALRDHPTLPDLCLEAIHRINRDIVDAERQLRIQLRPQESEEESPSAEDEPSVTPQPVTAPMVPSSSTEESSSDRP